MTATADELVLTTRRARIRTGGGPWVAARLRVTEQRLVLTVAGGPVLDADLRAVRLPSRLRPVLVVEGPEGATAVRCFGLPGVAALIRLAR